MLVAPALDPATAAAPSTPSPLSPRHQLRAPIADFVGRAHEIDQLVTGLREALEQDRGAIISGVQGMGGIGKTELAYATAHRLRDAFPDAQLVLNLRGSSAVLITSRQCFSLPGMATVQLEQLGADEAVTLLRAICLRLGVTEAEQIARACGHLPLALRISGAILHSGPALPVASYLARLGDERQQLRSLRDPDAPHLDVEASLALSYAQLDAATQQVFRQLGVLVADFATELAQAVVEVPEDVEIEATLQQLLRRNLVMYDAAQAHWRLHDLVRDLARSLLETAGETEAAWWRYARAAVQITQEMQAQYNAGGDGMLAALARFDAERPHIDAASSRSARRRGRRRLATERHSAMTPSAGAHSCGATAWAVAQT